MVNARIEVCANLAKSCVESERGGAYRVELCAGMAEGGTIYSFGEVIVDRRAVGLKLNVIIRPRGGDFCYSELDMDSMIADIEAMKLRARKLVQ